MAKGNERKRFRESLEDQAEQSRRRKVELAEQRRKRLEERNASQDKGLMTAATRTEPMKDSTRKYFDMLRRQAETTSKLKSENLKNSRCQKFVGDALHHGDRYDGRTSRAESSGTDHYGN